MAAVRWDIPDDRSWYVAFGCTADRNAFGLNDFEEMRIDASVHC